MSDDHSQVMGAVARLQGCIQDLEEKIQNLSKMSMNHTNGHSHLSKRLFALETRFGQFIENCGQCQVRSAKLDSLVLQHEKALNGNGKKGVIELAVENQKALQALLVEQRTLLGIGRWLVATVVAIGGLVVAVLAIF